MKKLLSLSINGKKIFTKNIIIKTGKREKRLGKNQGRLKVGCGVV